MIMDGLARIFGARRDLPGARCAIASRADPCRLYASSPVVPWGSLLCGREGVDRRAAHSRVCDRQPAWTGCAVGEPGEVGERRATVRSAAQLSAAGHPALDRGTRRHGHPASGSGRSLGGGEHRGEQQPWDPGSTAGKPPARSSAHWSRTTPPVAALPGRHLCAIRR
jgi:hypothetical protein